MTREKEEQLLRDNGFKKEQFSDRSSYWWVKKMNRCLSYYADPDFGHYSLDAYTLDSGVEPIKKFRTLKALLKSKESFHVNF